MSQTPPPAQMYQKLAFYFVPTRDKCGRTSHRSCPSTASSFIIFGTLGLIVFVFFFSHWEFVLGYWYPGGFHFAQISTAFLIFKHQMTSNRGLFFLWRASRPQCLRTRLLVSGTLTCVYTSATRPLALWMSPCPSVSRRT